MKTLFNLALMAALWLTGAPSNTPQPVLMYDASGNAFPSGSGATLGYSPQAVTCYTNTTGSVQPCSFTGGTITPGAGSNSTPSITSTVDTTTGFHFPAAGQIAYTSATFDQWIAASGIIALRSTVALKWSSGAPSTSSNDTGISRVSAGIVQLNNGTANTGGGLQIPALKSATGVRFVCIDTSGNLTSSTTACVGT